MSQTPETDELERELEAAAPGRTFDAMVELSRKLERERDNYKFRLSEQQERQTVNLELITAQRDHLLTALRASIEHVRAWHGMGVPKDAEPSLWSLYWNNAPEMKPLREMLSRFQPQP